MTEPPPWARPDPASPRPDPAPSHPSPARRPPGPAPRRPESVPEPDPEPVPEDPPLFPSEPVPENPLLFPGGPARLRLPGGDPPDVTRGASRRTGPDGPPPGRRPPPAPDAPPSVAPAPAGSAPAGPVVPPADPFVGLIAGPIEQMRARQSYPGFVVLTVAAVLSATTLAGRALVGTGSFWLVLVPVLVVAAVWPVQRLAGRDDLAVPVRRFRLQPPDGRTGHFVLVGETAGGELSAGDLIRVHPGGRRDGFTVARSADVLASLTGPVVRRVTTRPGAAGRAGRLSRLSLVLAALLVLASAVLVATG